MLTIIFDITDDNKILVFNPQSSTVSHKKVSLDATYLYRKKLDEEIMICSYIYNI